MAYYDVSNPSFDSRVRQIEPTDWAHANVLNQTIKQLAENTVAMHNSISRLHNVTVKASEWSEGKYAISDSRIGKTSLVEIFWAANAKETVIDCEIDGYTEDGRLSLTCVGAPKEDLLIEAIEIRNEVADDAG